MLDMIFTYSVIVIVMTYSIILLRYSNKLIEHNLENKNIVNCNLDENVMATQGIAITILFFSILTLISALHAYNPKTLEAIVNLGGKIPYSKYLGLCIVLGLAIYVLVITKENQGCADAINVDTKFLDVINIGVICMITIYIIYKVYRISKGTPNN